MSGKTAAAHWQDVRKTAKDERRDRKGHAYYTMRMAAKRRKGYGLPPNELSF